ncbi:hypothetical protein DFJ77DRAFT_447336, partial [Powellomyces hirtus]
MSQRTWPKGQGIYLPWRPYSLMVKTLTITLMSQPWRRFPESMSMAAHASTDGPQEPTKEMLSPCCQHETAFVALGCLSGTVVLVDPLLVTKLILFSLRSIIEMICQPLCQALRCFLLLSSLWPDGMRCCRNMGITNGTCISSNHQKACPATSSISGSPRVLKAYGQNTIEQRRNSRSRLGRSV